MAYLLKCWPLVSDQTCLVKGQTPSNTKLFLGMLLTFSILAFTINFFEKSLKISAIPSLIEQKTTCTSALSENPEQLTVFVHDEQMGKLVLNYLCKSQSVSKQFGNVALIVGQNDYDTFRYVNYGIANLSMVKQSVMDAYQAATANDYQLIAHYKEYNAYFIGRTEKPQLTKEYLIDKRIGLLDYPSSRSGHIVPKSLFQQLKIKESALNIRYFNSHSELRKSLLAGELDMIASYWADTDNDSLSLAYRTKIVQHISGVQWYLRGALRNPILLCEVQKAISKASDAHTSLYFEDVQFDQPCGLQPQDPEAS